jgi:hypothetical protein
MSWRWPPSASTAAASRSPRHCSPSRSCSPRIATFLREAGAGPQMVAEAVAAHLAAEQKIGRVRETADPAAVAHLLLGGCLNYAFLGNFTDRLPWPGDEECAQALSASIRELL